MAYIFLKGGAMKEKVLIVFGGKSVEHDISIITALQAMKNLPNEYEFLPVYIDKEGVWWIADNLQDVKIYKNFKKMAKNLRQVSVIAGENSVLVKKHNRYVPYASILGVLNCCHGGIGENGSLQGLFNVSDVPQTSCGVLSSSICMDKTIMKYILIANDINTPDFFVLRKDTFQTDKMLKKVKFPVIVKPANLGSSIGISVCKNAMELDEALSLAFEFDKKVVVEKLVENLQEFNCAIFEYKNKLIVSDVNQVTNKGEIFSFDDKYLTTSSEKHDVKNALAKKVREMTEKVYRLFDCDGVVRVDFLYDEIQKKLFVNEINTIPGSLGFYLFKDLPFKEIINTIIQEGIEQKEDEKKLVKTFSSDALTVFENAVEYAKK